MADNQQTVPQNLPSTDILINRFFLSPADKMKKESGKQILQKFYTQQTSSNDNLNFFRGRNARFMSLLLWAKGSQDQQEFLDFSNVSDGNKAWVNMDMTQQRVAPKFVGTLVESMAKIQTYACVEAIDEWSKNEKEDRLLEALFRMREMQTIQETQQAAGMPLEPQGAYVPEDELSAKIHFEIEDKLPKEIRFEQMLQDIQNDINFERVLNRKTIYDLVVLNFGATKIEKSGDKNYTARRCVPTNMAYNFFMNDTGQKEIDMIGEFANVKVRDFRNMFGKTSENPDGLTEQQIFNLAKQSTYKNIGTFNFQWSDNYSSFNYNQVRPYDDCNILILDAEVDCGEDVYYVEKPDAYGKMNITEKSNIPYQVTKKDGTVIPQDKPDDVVINKRKRNTWMRGVYAPYGDQILYWGKPDLIITPYTDTSRPLSSFTVNIPNNDGDYVPSLFERIMEPLREYTIVKLKRKQLISQLRPSGIRIDVESARNIDLGNGDSIAWEEVLRIYNATGTEVYSSKGVDPLQKEAPAISNTAVDTAVQKIVELTNILAGIMAEIRLLIGVPTYRDGADVGDRTSGVLQEQQMTASFNDTDYIKNGNDQLWEETYHKLCLLYWNDIVREEPESKADMLNTRFKTVVKTKSTEYQNELLEKDIDRYSQMPDAQGNPSLTPLDVQYLREIDNAKLRRWYLGKVWKENRERAISDKDRAEKNNAASQQQSLKIGGENDLALQKQKQADEKEMKEFESTKAKELAMVNGMWQGIAKGFISPQIAMPVLQQLMPNIVMPLQVENKEMSDAMQAEAQEQIQSQQQPQTQDVQQQEQNQLPQDVSQSQEGASIQQPSQQ